MLQVHALDVDSGVNGEVVYDLVEGDKEKFTVEGKTGKITLRRKLQTRDENNKFELVVEARDKGRVYIIIIIIIIQFLYSANSRMANRCAAQEKY